MKLIIMTLSELDVDVEKLKLIENLEVDDIFKNGRYTACKSNFTIEGDGDINFDRDIEKKILSILNPDSHK